MDVEIRKPLELVDVKLSKDAKTVGFAVRNNAGQDEKARAVVGCGGRSVPVNVQVGPGASSSAFSLPLDDTSRLVPGLNPVTLSIADRVVFQTNLECWDLLQRAGQRKSRLRFEPIDISSHFNDNLAHLHAHQYVSPRSPYCSLQIATDLFRDWCHATMPSCGELDLGILKKRRQRTTAC